MVIREFWSVSKKKKKQKHRRDAARRPILLIMLKISHSDIFGITIKAPCEVALMGERHVCIEIQDSAVRVLIQADSGRNLLTKMKG